MIPLPRGARVLVLVSVLAVALVACSRTSSTAAVVGEGEISVEELEADIALFGFLTGLSGAPCGTPVLNESQDAACARFALTNDIREEVAKAYATEHDVSLEPGVVADAIDQLEQSLGGPEALRAQLEGAGVTRSDVEALAMRLLLVNAVQEAVVAERLDEETLRAAYEAELGTFTTIEVEHILVQERADAERIAAEVTPETFATTAQRESIDPGSAPRGGTLGSFSETGFAAQFDPDFVAATLALEAGEISGAVRTQFGWHVIRLVRSDVAPFEDVVEQLRARESGSVFQDWYFEQLASIDVDVNPRFGRFDPETGEVVPIRSTADEPTGPTQPTGP